MAIGADAIGGAAGKGRAYLIVIAGDAAASAPRRLGAEAEGVPRIALGTRVTLGRAVGRPVAALVAVTDRSLAGRILAVGGGGAAAEDPIDTEENQEGSGEPGGRT